MKKSFLLLAGAAAVLASCSKTETSEMAQGPAIGFSDAWIGNAVESKAVSNIASAGDIGKFIVYGGYDNNGTYVSVFNNTVVSKSESSWTYGPDLKYWIPEKMYKFSAFAPEGAVTSQTTDDGYLSFSYTSDLNGDAAQKDLIYAAHTQKAATTGDAAIQFQFKHLLSMIKFHFTTDMAEGVTVKVSDLKISGVKSTASFTGDKPTTVTDFGGTWSGQTTPGAETAIPGIENDEGITIDAAKETIPFVVIPQIIAASNITVKFTVSATGNGVDIQDKEVTATIPAGEWEMGHRYNYSAEISGDKLDLHPIVFGEPNVTEWDDDQWTTPTPTN